MELLTDPHAWLAFVTLSALEIVLGIDNIIFISVLVGRLPPEQRKRARNFGLLLAMGSRIALLLSIVWLIGLTRPWFTVLGNEISGRDVVLIAGGLFLLAKSVTEIHHTLEGAAEQKSARVFANFILTHRADRDRRHRVLAGLGVHGGRPRRAKPGADHGGSHCRGHPGDDDAGRTDLGFRRSAPHGQGAGPGVPDLVGVALVADGLDTHVPKGYLYFAMAFSVGVEMINLRLRKLLDRRRRPQRLGWNPVSTSLYCPTGPPKTVGRAHETSANWSAGGGCCWRHTSRRLHQTSGRGRRCGRCHQGRRVRFAHRQGSGIRPVLHKGTQLAIDELNAAGGVLGKQIELITEDNRSTAGESATIVKKLITRDKVVAILGEVASSRSLEAAPRAQEAHIPMISPSSTNPKVTETGDYIFRVCFIDPFQGGLLAGYAQRALKAKKVAILSDVSADYSVGLAQFFREAFVAGGGQIVSEQKYTGGDKDFKAQLTAIKSTQPDAIMVPGYYNEVGLIVAQARQLGIKVPLIGGDGWEAPELLKLAGADCPAGHLLLHALLARKHRAAGTEVRGRLQGEVQRNPRMPWLRWVMTRQWCWQMPSSGPAPPTGRSCAMRWRPPAISRAPLARPRSTKSAMRPSPR